MRGYLITLTLPCFPIMPAEPENSALITIKSVYHHPLNYQEMWGAHLDQPKPETTRDAFSLGIRGWVISRGPKAVSVEYLHAGDILGSVPICDDRADLVVAFPNAKDALKSGFHASFSTVKLPPEADIFVQAVLEDQTRVPIAVVSIKREPVSTSYAPKLQPVLISTLGRTGSTWVVRVLGEHPQMVAYRPFQCETRISGYWLGILRTIAEPCSYYQAMNGELYDETWWLGTKRSRQAPEELPDANITRWFARDTVQKMAAFAMERMDSFYTEVAQMQGKSEAAFFVEKCWPESYVPQVLSEVYPGGKEIILVRDFRDMACSIFSFNKKRGIVSFGRQFAESDMQFIKQLRESAVRTLEHWRSRGKAAHMLRYEDLILRPEATLREVFGYLGLAADDETIAATLKRAHSLDSSLQTEHQTSKDPKASIGRWRSDLDDSLKAACNDAFGDVLAQFGYDA